MTFRELLFTSDYSVEQVATVFQVTPRTIRNWVRYGPPTYVVERLSLPSGSHPDWIGYKLRDGFVITPEGESVSKHQISMYHWTVSAMKAEARRFSVLQEKFDAIERVGVSANDCEPSNLIKLSRL